MVEQSEASSPELSDEFKLNLIIEKEGLLDCRNLLELK